MFTRMEQKGDYISYLDYNYHLSCSSPRYTFEQVKILKTFDSTGDTAYHRGRVRDSRSPHFHGPGQKIVRFPEFG